MDAPTANSWLTPEATQVYLNIASNSNLDIDQRVLAWAKLKAWGNGKEFAACQMGELSAPLAKVVFYGTSWQNEQEKKEKIAAFRAELIVASQERCAIDLHVRAGQVRSAVARLVKQGVLTTPWMKSHSLATTHSKRYGYRARYMTKWVRAFCPMRDFK